MPTTEEDWAGVAEELGGVGELKGGMLFRVPFPRTDLRVVSQGVVVTTAAIQIFLGFVRYADGSTLAMGDFTVTEEEVQPVTAALQAGGVAQTAIHKHLLGQRPEVWWLHFHAHGHDAPALARALRAAVERTGAPLPPESLPQTPPDLDTAGIDAALGVQGVSNSGMYQGLFVRRETIVDAGFVLPRGFGSTTALNFQPLGGGRAALNGDLAMAAGEVQDVLAALSRGGIDVVTLHNHSLSEDPRLFFVHTWAVGDAVEIATGLRPAVDATNVVPAY